MTIALLCAGEIGFKSLSAIMQFPWITLRGVFSYKTDESDQYFLKIQEACSNAAVQFFEDQRVDRQNYVQFWNEQSTDYIISVKWHHLIPKEVLNSLRKELIVFHASMLPAYRGFAPIHWPIINGERESGVTMFYGANDVDAGDIIDQVTFAITDDDDASTVHVKVIDGVVRLLTENLPKLRTNTANRIQQDHSKATYAIWRSAEDGKIDWAWTTIRIHNFIRGLTPPAPGAFTTVNGQKLSIWKSEILDDRRYVGAIPGKVERILPNGGVSVLTGDGVICILKVSINDGEVVPAASVITRLKTVLG